MAGALLRHPAAYIKKALISRQQNQRNGAGNVLEVGPNTWQIVD
jgi:hypothetical protein